MLVNATVGHSMFSFIDGFDSYLQIKMASQKLRRLSFRFPWATSIT